MKLHELFNTDEDERWVDDEELLTKIIVRVLLVVMVVTIVLMVLMFSGCKTYHDTEIVEKHDTLTVYQTQRDSIYLHDSVFHEIVSRGDTVFVTKDRWHTQYRDRWHHDSIYIAKVDTVVVERTIEKQSTFMEKAKQKVRGFIMAAVLAVAAFFGLRWVLIKWADRR